MVLLGGDLSFLMTASQGSRPRFLASSLTGATIRVPPVSLLTALLITV